MILPSRRRRRWLLASLALTAALAVSYGYYRTGANVHGGSLPGLLYGAAGLLLILWLLAFGLRKRAYRSRLGTLDGWLQAHVYLGLTSVVVVAFHAGFRFQDRVATASFLVLLLVVLSGLVGAVLYTAVPRRLTSAGTGLSAEEISDELGQLESSMARLAAARSASFRRIHAKLVARTRPRALAGWRLLFAGSAPATGESRWEPLLALVEESEREALRKLLVLSRQHSELHQRLRHQQRYKNLLEAWLYLHLPLSIALMVLVAVHIVAAFYFRGFLGAGGAE